YPNHPPLYPTRSTGRLAGVRPRRGKTRAFGMFANSMNRPSLEHIFEAHIQTLALTLRPSTVIEYQRMARRFLRYLQSAFPEVCQLSQLRRDPHLLGWFRSMCERKPPLRNQTRN